MPSAQKRQKKLTKQQTAIRRQDAKDLTKKNECSRLLRLPGEIRNIIYSMVLARGQSGRSIQSFYKTRVQLAGPPYYQDISNCGLLQSRRQLRAEGLRFLISNNAISIQAASRNALNDFSSQGYFVFEEPPNKVLELPRALFQHTRDLTITYQAEVRTHSACQTHNVMVALSVIGDTYSCRIWGNLCDDERACYQRVAAAILRVRKALIELFESKVVPKKDEEARKFQLVIDESMGSPRYAGNRNPGPSYGFERGFLL